MYDLFALMTFIKIKVVYSEFIRHNRLLCYIRVVLPRYVVRLSVRMSITLVLCVNMFWNSSQIISYVFTLPTSLSLDPIITHILQGEHPEIPAGIGKFDDFPPLSLHISETVQDTTKVTIDH